MQPQKSAICFCRKTKNVVLKFKRAVVGRSFKSTAAVIEIIAPAFSISY